MNPRLNNSWPESDPYASSARKFGAITLTLFVFLCLWSPACLKASDATASLDKANRLYEQGKYSEAQSAYDALLTNGVVAEAVYFNRGNAAFNLNHLGQAIDSYRRALQLFPRDSEARKNLALTRARARGEGVYQYVEFVNPLLYLSLNEWTCLAAVAFWVVMLLLILSQWQSEFAPKVRRWIFISTAALLVFAVGLAVSLHTYLTPVAIVTAGEADVRNGPLEEALSLFKVRDGTELVVTDSKNGWLQVTDSAQRTGWLRQNQAILSGHLAGEK